MANSAHLALRAAIAAALSAAPALASGNIQQNRDYALPTGIAAQVNVNFVSTEATDSLLGADAPRDWDSVFELAFTTRAASGVEAADAADALWTEAYARLMADDTLGGLAMQLLPGSVDVTWDEGGTSVARVTWTVTAKHTTTHNVIAS
jgi:hypothetical protein